MNIKPKLLFNPESLDNEKKVFAGDTTNTFNLFDIKYKWAYETVWPQMLQNHWIPEKSGLNNDKSSFKSALSEEEKEAFLKILSFLIYLDSIQTNNVPNIADYITAPEIILCLARQTFDEALHSRSYGYIMSSIFDRDTALKSIYYWRDDKILLERNKYIANIYQEFKDNPSDDGFIKVLIANYLLEGIYFYNGFHFFYNLASRGLMTETSVQIKYINRDELMHCFLFRNIILDIQKENPELWKKNIANVEEMFNKAVEQEISFSKHVIGNKILGMSDESIEEYTHYIANRRMKDIKLKPLFKNVENPYKHLSSLAGIEDETSSKVGVFEQKSIAYKQSNIFSQDDWSSI